MLNFLIPLGAASKFFEGSTYHYPKPLVEIFGKPMIQQVIENLSQIDGRKKFIFIVREEDCIKHHLDSTLKLLAGNDAVIIKLQREAKGAACSALLAIDLIYNDDTLIIANGDQLFDADLNQYLQRFKEEEVSGGCLWFESVHPRWSYVRLENSNEIIEVAEKRPITKNAIAGFFYFNKGKNFVDAAFKMIKKDANVNNQYYISPVLNEMVLDSHRLRAYQVKNSDYHTFYSPKKIEEYESGRGR